MQNTYFQHKVNLMFPTNKRQKLQCDNATLSPLLLTSRLNDLGPDLFLILVGFLDEPTCATLTTYCQGKQIKYTCICIYMLLSIYS